MFSNLSTSDSRTATSPLATSSLSSRSDQQTRNSFSSMMSPTPHQFNQPNGATPSLSTRRASCSRRPIAANAPQSERLAPA